MRFRDGREEAVVPVRFVPLVREGEEEPAGAPGDEASAAELP